MLQVAGQLPYEKRGGRWPRREGGIETKRRRRGRARRVKMGMGSEGWMGGGGCGGGDAM